MRKKNQIFIKFKQYKLKKKDNEELTLLIIIKMLVESK